MIEWNLDKKTLWLMRAVARRFVMTGEGVREERTLGEPRRKIVCLCGSTRFWKTFQEAGLRETLAGHIVLSIGAASATDDEHFMGLTPAEWERQKAALDELHLDKIDLADEVLVLNVGNYIGESTARELAYARSLGVPVRFLEEHAQE